MLRAAEQDDDITQIAPRIAALRQAFTTLLVLGMGGSTLNPQTLTALAPLSTPRILYWDSIDPESFKRLIDTLDLTRTLVLVTSKSGKTMETLTQFLAVHHVMQARVAHPAKHYLMLSDPGENPLRSIAKTLGVECLDHPADIGGRFATFTLVTLIPAMMAGLDVCAFKSGARDTLHAWQRGDNTAPDEAAALHMRAMEAGFGLSVLMPYQSMLEPFSQWYSQIWAESLGKQGKGSTPIRALGPLDQHSQLQLYLEGPRDKLFTLITRAVQQDHTPLARFALDDPMLTLLSGKSLGEILEAEQTATVETLRSQRCPLRVLEIQQVDEKTLGALMMHFMLETLITAELLGVDPFDQPAVEHGKHIAAEWLRKGR